MSQRRPCVVCLRKARFWGLKVVGSEDYLDGGQSAGADSDESAILIKAEAQLYLFNVEFVLAADVGDFVEHCYDFPAGAFYAFFDLNRWHGDAWLSWVAAIALRPGSLVAANALATRWRLRRITIILRSVAVR